MSIVLNNDQKASFKKAASVYRAINHPIRQQILSICLNEPTNVTSIYIKLRTEQSVASQHLSILRKAGLVQTERKGKSIYYSVNTSALDKLHELATQTASL